MTESVLPAKTRLIQQGWREIGNGAYAFVFQHPGENHVLKLFTSADTAYLDFVNFVKRNPNEHFPKFGHFEQVDEEHWTVEIEKLQPITAQYKKEVRIIGNIIALLKYRSYETIVQMIRDEEGREPWQVFISYLDEHPAMKEAIFLLMPLLTEHFNDLGESNFMLRGDVLVFSDPVETIR